MKNGSRMAKKVLSLLLVLLLVLGTFPLSFMTAFADDGEDLTETVTGNQLLTIDDTNPEGNDPNDTGNPYGATYDAGGTGTGTLMIPWNELSVLTENYDKNVHNVKVYCGDKGSSKNKALADFDSVWTPSSTNNLADLYSLSYVQGVGFDKTGSGRKDVSAYVGFDSVTNRYYLTGIDTSRNEVIKTNLVHWVYEVSDYKEYKPVFINNDDWNADHYAANSLLDITAGNFGRGYETVVVATSCVARDGSNGTSIIMFEYADINGEWQRVGDPVLFDTVSNTNYLNTVSLSAGDLNGDGADELVVVLAKSEGAPYNGGEAKMYVYSGVPKGTTSIFTHSRTDTSICEDYKEGEDNYRLSMQSPGVSVGDVDGDGINEVAVGGYQWISKNNNSYEAKKAQLLGIYEQNTSGGMTKVVLTDPGMNAMITRGYYVADNIHPRAALATVAFNGQNGKDLVFFNGQIFTYNPDAGFSATYTPEYFNHTDIGMGSVSVSNAWISDVAVGNFDHNNIGREQVYYVVALKESSSEAYGYKVGMIGATYNDTEDMLGTLTGSGFYSTDIDNDDYQLNDADAYTDRDWRSCHTVITSVDNNADGVSVRYRGKNYVYSDPKIEAVLQAAPYFNGVQDPGSTVYSIETTYGESDNTTTSLDWGVGFSGEAEVSALWSAKMALEVGAAFNYTWEWETGWETSYKSCFETTDQNTVLVQRTPIIFYNYDMYDAESEEWLENALQIPMPLGPVWSQLSISDYNQFVDDYNAIVATIKAKADTSNYTYEPPVLKKIVDTAGSTTENGEYLISNEGNPEAYLSDWNNGDLTDAEKLSNMADMQLGYSGTSKTQEYAHSEYATDGEGFSGGFSIHFSSMWGVGLAGLADARAGFYIAADFLKGTCHYKTTTRGNTVSGTVNDLNERTLREQGLSDEIIRSYQFFWSFGRWYVDMGSGGGGTSLEEILEQEDLEDRLWDNSHVPVYGYKVANISIPPLPPELSVSYDDGVFTLSWKDEHADAVDGYYAYQVVNGEYVPLNTDRISAGTKSFEVSLTDLDNSAGNLYLFVATSAVDLADGGELKSIWSNEVSYVPAISGPEGPQGIGIESIVKDTEYVSSDGLTDKYIITLSDGSKSEFYVRNGKDGENGDDGTNGKDAYDVAVENGYSGTYEDWLAVIGAKCAADGHTFVTYSIPGSCGVEGVSLKVCSDCGYAEAENTSALSHNYKVIRTVLPTCTASGYTVHKCENCGDIYYDTETAAVGHNYSETVVEPSHNACGYTRYICENCGDTYCDNLTAITGHTYTEKVVEPTCVESGYTEKTCSECGIVIRTDIVPATGHNFSEKVVEPTCTESGYTEKTCEDCGLVIRTDTVSAAGHDYSAVVTEPTCGHYGYTTYTCAVCGDEYVSDITPAAEHTFKTKVIENTCTVDGFTIKYCAECGYSTIIDETEAKGHDFEVTQTVEPTCLTKGYSVYTCKNCGITYNSDEVDCTEHKFTDKVIDSDCTHTGYTIHTCDDCGFTKIDSETPVTEHVPGEWVCEDPMTGRYVQRCENCYKLLDTKTISIVSGSDGEGEGGNDNPLSPNIDENGVLNIGYKESEKIALQADGIDTSTVVYTSSNPTVVTVDSEGNITAVGPGEAVITASIPGTAIQTQVPVSVKLTWWQKVHYLLDSLTFFRALFMIFKVIIPNIFYD